jgi:hypothetical protein
MTSTISSTVEKLEALNAYDLASLADCGIPRNSSSDGAEFLTSVRDSFVEYLKEADNEGEEFDPSEHSIVDENLPVFHSEQWGIFVDLEAFHEDTREIGLSDMNTMALGLIAEIGNRLVSALAGEIEVN